MQRKIPARQIPVSGKEDGMTILAFLKRACPGAPKQLYYKWIRKKLVRVNGQRTGIRSRLATGDTVRVPSFSAETAEGKKSADTEIILQNNDFIALNKPSGIPVHGGTGTGKTVISAFSTGDIFTPVPVHRLDKDTSGVLLLACTHKAARSLKKDWSLFKKFYVAVVDNSSGKVITGRTVSLSEELTLTDGRDCKSVKKSRACRLSYRCLVHGSQSVLVIRLHTGRKRQIRLQLSSQEIPVLGDCRYGSPDERLFLHCRKLVFFLNRRRFSVKSPLPTAFTQYISGNIHRKKVE